MIGTLSIAGIRLVSRFFDRGLMSGYVAHAWDADGERLRARKQFEAGEIRARGQDLYTHERKSGLQLF